jgi:hypothetical protein
MDNDTALQQRKQIETYIMKDFLPNFFVGFKKKRFNSNRTYHQTSFEFKDVKYVFQIYTLSSGYAGYLYILEQAEIETQFPLCKEFEELTLEINKGMKKYKLSKLYDN